jgi:hypothetical protein
MAAIKKAPVVRRTFYLGSKKIQAGPLKGGVRPGFLSMDVKSAAAIGLKLNLPKDIPGTTYTEKNGLIMDEHTTKGGKKVRRPVKGIVGKKKIHIVVEDAKTGGKRAIAAKGKKAFSGAVTTKVITLGVPSWASIETLQTFLKGSKAQSFSMNGQQIPVVSRGKK